MKSLSVGDEVPFSLHRISFLPVQNILPPCIEFPFSLQQNYFKGLEIYFKASEIYFQAFEIYFRATEKVFIRGGKNFSL